MKDIKIFISYHDNDYYRIKSQILNPIQTGCIKAKKIFSGMFRDDIGENISDKNDKYCELTSQYWVWKNYDKIGNPEYIGFMHYRRHFMFDNWIGNSDYCWLPKGHVYFVNNISNEYMKHISDENIRKSLKGVDCIVLKSYDVKNLQSKNIREQYSKLKDQDVKTFDIFILVLKEMYPNYLKEIEKLEKGSIQYLCNMFIMRKKLFFEYSNFCFSVLHEVDKRIDSSKMSLQGKRFLGYLGEYCLSIFIFHLLNKKQYKIKEISGSYILTNYKENFYKHSSERLFSLKNLVTSSKCYKILTIFGIKIHFRKDIRFIEYILSVRNEYNYKILRILGFKIKFKRKNRDL